MAVLTEATKKLYGFSRGTQALLSIAQPLVAVLVVTDDPPLPRLAATTAALALAYVAVFALNDLLDVGLDRARFDHERSYDGFDVDSAGFRHPVARGALPFGAAVAWVGGLMAVSLAIAAWLGPVCVVLLVVAAGLEVLYCRLATVTPHKCALSGVMVALGAAVGAFAMDVPVPALPLGLFLVWLALWEIGGRNLVNDMGDVEEDSQLGIRTVPVVRGPVVAARWAFRCALGSSIAGIALAVALQPLYGLVGVVGVAVAAWTTLLDPARKLLREPTAERAMAVFNRGTFHPVLVLAALLLGSAV